MIFEFEFGERIKVDEGDGDGGISGWGVGGVLNVGDGIVVVGKGGEDVVVVVEIEGDGVSQDISP